LLSSMWVQIYHTYLLYKHTHIPTYVRTYREHAYNKQKRKRQTTTTYINHYNQQHTTQHSTLSLPLKTSTNQKLFWAAVVICPFFFCHSIETFDKRKLRDKLVTCQTTSSIRFLLFWKTSNQPKDRYNNFNNQKRLYCCQLIPLSRPPTQYNIIKMIGQSLSQSSLMMRWASILFRERLSTTTIINTTSLFSAPIFCGLLTRNIPILMPNNNIITENQNQNHHHQQEEEEEEDQQQQQHIWFAVPKSKITRSRKRMKTTAQKRIPLKKNIVFDPRTGEVTLKHKLPFNWKDYLPKID
jgi:ribosomal protein L32